MHRCPRCGDEAPLPLLFLLIVDCCIVCVSPLRCLLFICSALQLAHVSLLSPFCCFRLPSRARLSLSSFTSPLTASRSARCCCCCCCSFALLAALLVSLPRCRCYRPRCLLLALSPSLARSSMLRSAMGSCLATCFPYCKHKTTLNNAYDCLLQPHNLV